MNMLTRAAVVLAVAWCGLSQACAAPDVVGIWSALSRTKGGLGAQWIFTRDGDVIFSYGALIDSKYEIDGDRMRTKLITPAGRKDEVVEEFSIEGDVLTTTLVQSPSYGQTMQRVGFPRSDCPAIVGDWEFVHPTGQLAIMRYSRSGLAQLAVALTSMRGTYRVEGNLLHIHFAGHRVLGAKFRHEDGVLVIADGNDKEGRFARFEH